MGAVQEQLGVVVSLTGWISGVVDFAHYLFVLYFSRWGKVRVDHACHMAPLVSLVSVPSKITDIATLSRN